MPPKATIILDFAVSQTWKCLSVPIKKTRVFSEAFFDEEILSEIASAAKLTFAPGLLKVVNAPKPPSVKFFKNLPAKYLGLWGIYVLVLEKPGCTTLIYIGEASDAKRGIRGRWMTYNKPKTYRKYLPSKVAEALDAGYKIVHKGVLAWCPIPSAKNVPRFRVLAYALEAMFSFLFWTMYSKTDDYRIGSCCPWDRESFTYGGLCSHSALTDPMRANLKLSAEQLEMLAAQNNESKKQAADRRRKRVEAKIYYCEDCEQAVDSPSELEKHKNTKKHKNRVAKLAAGVEFKFRCEPCGKGFASAYDYETHEESAKHKAKVAALPAGTFQPPDLGAPVKRRHRRTKAERDSQNLYCDICELPFKKPYELPRHLKSKRHKNRVAELAAGTSFEFRCPPCGYSGKSEKLLDDHTRSAKHKAKMAAA